MEVHNIIDNAVNGNWSDAVAGFDSLSEVEKVAFLLQMDINAFGINNSRKMYSVASEWHARRKSNNG